MRVCVVVVVVVVAAVGYVSGAVLVDGDLGKWTRVGACFGPTANAPPALIHYRVAGRGDVCCVGAPPIAACLDRPTAASYARCDDDPLTAYEALVCGAGGGGGE